MNNSILLNLLEARVTLYATQPDGTLGPSLWSGAPVERMTVHERWLSVETRPTGAKYPRQHPLVAQYELSLDRVWALPLNQLAGWHPQAQDYVLDVVWIEEDAGDWHRRTFYGVTVDERAFEAADMEHGFVDRQSFRAQYFLLETGSQFVVPTPTVAVPYRVLWSGPDGSWLLYNYTEAGGFVAAPDAAAESHATLASDGSSVRFAGAPAPALATNATGVAVGELHDRLPPTGPQVQFYRGNTLLGVVTPEGFWARNLRDASLPEEGFALKHQAVTVGRIGSGVSAALSWQVAG